MKKILMAAAAVTALTAGSASAASIYKALVSNKTVYDATAAEASRSTPYKIATETKYGDGLSTTSTADHNKITLKVDQGRLSNGGSNKDYVVTFTYAGNVGFKEAIDNTKLSLGHNSGTYSGCSHSTTLSEGGLAKGKSVTFVVNLNTGCTSTAGPDLFILDAPLTVTGSGEVTVTGKISTGGTSIDNGEATARTLIKNEAGIIFTTDTDTTATNWKLAGTTAYTTLTDNTDIGTYTLKFATADANTGPFINADATTRLDSLNLTADVKVEGDVSATSISIGGTNGTKNADKNTSSRTAIAASATAVVIKVVADADLKTSQPSRTYSMTVTPATTSDKFTAPSAKTQTLQTVGLEGTNFNVPWVAGSQSPSSTVIRIANNGTTDTGAVTVMIKSPIRNEGTTVGGTTCTSSTLSSLGKIAAGGELTLGATELKSCFGDFKRGDLVVTVQAATDNLTAKARLTTASGQISETSIGGLKQFGAY
jgi:hypothetical protein